jgi:GAF domain-containing protein
VDRRTSDDVATGQHTAIDMATLYDGVQDLLLDGPDLVVFLSGLAVLSASVVPGTSCGVTVRRDARSTIAASSDAFAGNLDRIQRRVGGSPCLETLRTGESVVVADLAEDDRWADYRSRALAAGLRSSVSVPLVVRGDVLGALDFFSRAPHDFSEPDTRRAEAFTGYAAAAVALLLRHTRQVALAEQMRTALTSRAMIDQALGIMMVRERVTSTEALAVLREESQNSNRKLSEVAAGLIEAVTGRPPVPPRPFVQRN